MQGTSALIRSYLHLFFYLISAVGGERQLGGCCRVDGGTRRGEKERDSGEGRGFSRCGGRLLRDSHINWIVARSKCM